MSKDPDLPRRLRWMAALAVATFAGLGARAGQIQGVRGADHAAALEAARVRRVSLPAPRGTVRDARGRVVAEDGPGRRYPFGPLGAHAIGYLNEVNPREVGAGGPYHPGDRIGRAGVERVQERTLRGTPGHAFRPASRRVSVPAGFEDVPPVPGADVTLTLDMELTRAVDAAFARHGVQRGAAVVLDAKRGDLRALVSRPAYDPNRVENGVRVADQEGASEIDRARMEPEIPGLVLKPFSALAVLRGGAPDPVSCAGHVPLGRLRWMCSHVHGPIDVRRALAEGCNVWFYHHALERTGLDDPAAAGMLATVGHAGDVQVPDDQWFAGFAPAEAPEVAVALHAKGTSRVEMHEIAAEVLQAISEGGPR